MRHSACISAAAVIVMTGVSLFATEAHAQGDTGGTPNQPPPNTPPPAVPPAPITTQPQATQPPPAEDRRGRRRNADDDDDDEDLKRISITINPLGLVISRYSLTGEYLLARHHALNLSPFYTSVPVEVNGVELSKFSGFGAELGYRFYTGSKGPNGFFVGPSFLFSSYSSTGSGTAAQQAASEKSFTALGGAIDIGGQGVIGPGIVIGGGFGMQYTSNSETFDTNNFNLASAIIAGGGLRPRFLFSFGFAF